MYETILGVLAFSAVAYFLYSARQRTKAKARARALYDCKLFENARREAQGQFETPKNQSGSDR